MEPNLGTTGTTPTPGMSAGQSASGGSGVSGALENAKERARSRVDESKARVSGSLSAVASTLRDSGQQLRSREEGMAGGYVEQVAERIERAANYLERADVGELVDEVERFARRQPALFIGAAFAIGVLGARFLKSSRTDIVPYRGASDASLGGGFGDREVSVASGGAADLSPDLTAGVRADARGRP